MKDPLKGGGRKKRGLRSVFVARKGIAHEATKKKTQAESSGRREMRSIENGRAYRDRVVQQTR